MDGETKNIIDRLRVLEERVLVLERQTRGNISTRRVVEEKDKYTGPTGGIKFLIDKGFFKEKRGLSTVRKKLQENGYNYSRQSINAALGRLSKQSGQLVALKEGKLKEYAERK